MGLTLNEYQEQSYATAQYPGRDTWVGLAYTALGLGEAGEFQGKVKKILRDDNLVVSDEKRVQMLGELGDILWYVAQAAYELHTDLESVAQANLHKLASRKERGVIGGSGDNR